MAALRGEFFRLDLSARQKAGHLVSVAFFRMAGCRREYQLEVRLPAGASWYKGDLLVELPESWGDAATRARFLKELASFVRTAAGPGNVGLGKADTVERRVEIRVPFDTNVPRSNPGTNRPAD